MLSSSLSKVQFGTKHVGKSNTFLCVIQIFLYKNAQKGLVCAQKRIFVQVFLGIMKEKL